MKPPEPTEREIQREILALVKTCFPRVMVQHSANAHGKRGKKGAIQAMMNKADGVKTGWPDLLFVAPQFIAFAEVKRRLGKPTEEQLAVMDTLSNYGFHVTLLRSAEQAYWWLRQIGAPWNGVPFVAERRAA